MWSWTFKASVAGQVRPSAIWEIWENVTNWPSWDGDLEWSRIEGPFAAGTEGSLKPKGFSPVKFKIIEAVPGVKFTDVATMPLATTLEFRHFIENLQDGQIQITHQVSARGFLAPILYFTLRRKLQRELPHVLQSLLVQAEKSQ